MTKQILSYFCHILNTCKGVLSILFAVVLVGGGLFALFATTQVPVYAAYIKDSTGSDIECDPQLGVCREPGGNTFDLIDGRCVAYNTTVNCTSGLFQFKDSSTAQMWVIPRSGGGYDYVMRTVNGNIAFIESGRLDKPQTPGQPAYCDPLPLFFPTTGWKVTVNCNEVQGLEDFNNKLGRTGNNKVVGSTSEIKDTVLTPQQLRDKGCTQDETTKIWTCPDGKKYNDLGKLIPGTAPNSMDDGVYYVLNEQFKKLLKGLIDLIAAILLLVVYFIGWAAIGIAFVLGWIFLFFLRLNPAGELLVVAFEPWRILVSIANFLTLASFLFVGFGYLLNIKSLKANIQDFLTNIVIFALALQFTILGAASVVNIFQGIGDVFIFSFVGNTDPEAVNRSLIGEIINSVGRVSLLRCGDGETCVVGSASGIQNGLSLGAAQVLEGVKSPLVGLFGGDNSQTSVTVLLMGELMFLFIIGVVIYVFWKAAVMAIFRAVSLWILMAVSPIALAAYFSPVEDLKKIGQKWVDKFVKWTLFYPVFIFALALSSALIVQFRNQLTNEQLNAFKGQGGADLFNLTLQITLGAGISIAILFLTLKLIDDDLEKWGKAALSGIGKLAIAGGAAAGIALGVAGAATGAVPGLASKGFKYRSNRLSQDINRLEAKDRELAARTDPASIAARKDVQRNLAEAKRAKDINDKRAQWLAKKGQQTNQFFKGMGDGINNLTLLPGVVKTLGQDVVSTFDKKRKVQARSLQAGVYEGIEYYGRRSGLGVFDDLWNYNSKFQNYRGQKGADLSPKDRNRQSIIRDAVEQERGINVDFRRKSAVKMMERYADKYAGMGDKVLEDYDSFTDILRQALKDPNLKNDLLSNPKIRKFVQDKYDGIFDEKLKQDIAEKATGLVGGKDVERIQRGIGQRLATDLEFFKSYDFTNAPYSPYVIEEFLRQRGNTPEAAKQLADRIPVINGYNVATDPAAIQQATDLFERDADLAKMSPGAVSAVKRAVNQVRLKQSQQGLSNEQQLIEKLIAADGNQNQIDTTFQEFYTDQFGATSSADVDRVIDNLVTTNGLSGAIKTLEQTFVGRDLTKTAEYQALTPSQEREKLEALRYNARTALISNESVRDSYEQLMISGAERTREAKQEVEGQIGLDKLAQKSYTKLSGLAQSTDPVNSIQYMDSEEFLRSVGMVEEWQNLQKSTSQNGLAKYQDSTGRDISYQFDSGQITENTATGPVVLSSKAKLSSEEIDRFTNELNRILTMKLENRPASEINTVANTVKSQFRGTVAEDFIDQQILDSNSDFWNKARNEGYDVRQKILTRTTQYDQTTGAPIQNSDSRTNSISPYVINQTQLQSYADSQAAENRQNVNSKIKEKEQQLRATQISVNLKTIMSK